MFCLAALSWLLTPSLSSTAWSSRKSLPTVRSGLPGLTPWTALGAPAGSRGWQTVPSPPQSVGPAEAAGGGPDARRGPPQLSRSPSLPSAGRAGELAGLHARRPDLLPVSLDVRPVRSCVDQGFTDSGQGDCGTRSARTNGPAWAETAPPLHPKGRAFRPRQRRNAEELGLLERK